MRRLLLGAAMAGIAHHAAAQGSWYYCDPAHAYYPYVSTCSVPWREVAPYSYGQGQAKVAVPPTAESAAPATVAPTPTINSPTKSQPSATYRQGQADRESWETWFGSLTGSYRAGAEYWAGQRSLAKPGSCDAAPSSGNADWIAGCIAAQQRLAASDVRRTTQRDYRLGWNNPAAVETPSPIAASPNLPAAKAPMPAPEAAITTSASQPSTPRDDIGHSPLPAASATSVSDASQTSTAQQNPAAPQSSDSGWIIGIVIAVIGTIAWRIRRAPRARGGRAEASRVAATEIYPANTAPAPIGSAAPSPEPEKPSSVPSTMPRIRVVTGVGSRDSARQLYSTPKRRREDARWIPPGASVSVNGFDIPGGMVYVGSFMSASPGGGWAAGEPAPCLINPALKVAAGKPKIDLDMGYWPSYSSIDPIHRLNYLHWLSSGKRDAGFPVGYAFLYFYGLERRLLADNLSHEEETLLIAELERLRNLYTASGSFTGYSTRLLDLVRLRRVSATPPGLDGWKPSLAEQAATMPIPLRLKLGVMAAMSTPLGFEHAMAAMLTMPQQQGGIRRGIGMTRTHAEFLDLARRRFATQFPSGFPLRNKKDSALTLTYRAASRNLEVSIRVEGIARVPDPMDLTWTKMIELCSKSADDLAPYARAVGKERVHANSVGAALALPQDFGDTPATIAFKRWLESLPGPLAEVPLNSLGRWCFGDGKATEGIKQAQQMSAILARVGYGMEPDPTYGSPRPRDTVLLFPALATAGSASAAFERAGLIAAVLASGEVTVDHGLRISSELASHLALTPAETVRIAARYRVMRGRTLPVSGLTKLGQSMTPEERGAVAALSASVAAVCGDLERSTITALERLHDALGVERRGLYAILHKGAANAAARAAQPVLVEQPSMPTTGFRIPPPPVQTPSSEFAIDMARVNAILRQTREVAQVLAPIYEDDATSTAQPAVEGPLVPGGSLFRGLGADHARLLGALCSEERWSRADYEAKARDFGLLPDGAIEAINEWAYDELGDELIEADDPLTINVALLREAPEEAA